MINLPENFRKYTQELMGDKLYQQLEQGLQADEIPTSIRLNPFKYKCDKTTKGGIIPWCPETGRYLASRPNFTFDPLFHAGIYYVQEASSMFIDLIIRQLVHQPVTMLDLCAAPGGKSTCLRAALPEGSLLFCNEPMRTRSQILAENVLKFGHPDMIVTNNYPQDYKKSKLQFDIILTDVPCSGEGMFRKDKGAIKEWSAQNVENCRQLQREIVSDIWNCLKPGGLLIYSTCTFNAYEDEENVTWIAEELGADFIKLAIPESWNITGNLIADNNIHPIYRFIPGKALGEGLFIAVLQKHGELRKEAKENVKAKDKKVKNKAKNKNGDLPFDIPTNWLIGNSYEYISIQENIFAIPNRWTEIMKEINSNLKVLHAGIKLGHLKGKNLIPDQGLALSILLNKDTFHQVELSYEEAISYLHKEVVNLPENTPKGYILVTYHHIPIGWEKNIGNRANNLYPQEWRIKSTHFPQTNNMVIKAQH